MPALPNPKTLVERFYRELWAHPDPQLAAAILDPGFHFTAPFAPPLRGRDAYLGYIDAVHAALAEYRCTIDALVVEGEHVAAQMRFTGVHRGPFFGVAPTHRPLAWTGAAFFRIDGDRIGTLWVVGDIDGLKRQLGAAPDAGFAEPPAG